MFIINMLLRFSKETMQNVVLLRWNYQIRLIFNVLEIEISLFIDLYAGILNSILNVLKTKSRR